MLRRSGAMRWAPSKTNYIKYTLKLFDKFPQISECQLRRAAAAAVGEEERKCRFAALHIQIDGRECVVEIFRSISINSSRDSPLKDIFSLSLMTLKYTRRTKQLLDKLRPGRENSLE